MANNTRVVTGKVRFSYLHVFKPAAVQEGQDPKYSVSIIIPKDDKVTLNKIRAAIEAATEAAKTEKFGGKIPAKLQTPLRDGDNDRPEDPAYADSFFVNCSSANRPGIVDRNLNAIIEDEELYSGCYGRVSINFYGYNVSGNKGIAAGLNNIQKLSDGEPLGNRSTPEADFGDEDFEDDEEY